MKKIILPFCVLLILFACSTPHTIATSKNLPASKNDTIRIANDELKYEIIIIDPGFNSWFAMNAKPRDFYSQPYLEARNRVWVSEWNTRAANPLQYRDLFEMQIDYQPDIDYGFEVNYMLFNYLTYFQLANKVRLGGFEPRI